MSWDKKSAHFKWDLKKKEDSKVDHNLDKLVCSAKLSNHQLMQVDSVVYLGRRLMAKKREQIKMLRGKYLR